jgi:hypothetical protein
VPAAARRLAGAGAALPVCNTYNQRAGTLMAEVVLQHIQVWEVVKIGYVGRLVPHGVFTTEAEAVARYYAVLKQQPGLAVTGSLQVRARSVETVEDAPGSKMRRAGQDYEDKAVYAAAHKGRVLR